MKKKLDLSDYQEAGRGRHFFGILIDFLIVALLTLFFYGVLVRPVAAMTPSGKDIVAKYQTEEEKTKEFTFATHLRTKDSDGKERTPDQETEYAIVTLVKSSCYKYGMAFKSWDGSKEIENSVRIEETNFYTDKDGAYSNDSLAYYYLTYRNDHQKDYSNNPVQMTRGKLNNEILKLSLDNKSLVEDTFVPESDVFVLSRANTTLANQYIEKNSGDGKTVINTLSALLSGAVDTAIKEIESYNTVYKEEILPPYQKSFKKYLGYEVLGICIAYLLSFLIAYLLLPLILGYGRTAGYRIMGLVPATADNTTPSFVRFLGKDVILFIEFFTGTMITPIFLGFGSEILYSFLGSLSLLQIYIPLVLVHFVSMLFLGFQTKGMALSDLVGIVTLDIKEHKEIGHLDPDGSNRRRLASAKNTEGIQG
jgi:hypothetical protein